MLLSPSLNFGGLRWSFAITRLCTSICCVQFSNNALADAACQMKVQVHELTKRREYMGAVMDLAKAVSECPSGGQIVCCSGTFSSILDQQARILQQVPAHADHEVLYEMLR